MELAVTRSLDLGEIISLVLWVLPLILFHSLPIAAVVGALLTFGRLAGDSELIATLAAGVSRVRTAAFPIAFSFVLAVFAVINNAVLVQMAYVKFDNVGFGVGLDPMKALRPGVVERIAGRHFAVRTLDADHHSFQGLFAVVPAEDAGRTAENGAPGGKWLLTAARGHWTLDPPWIHLALENGSIRGIASPSEGERPGIRVLKFGGYTLHVPLPIDRSTHPKRLTMSELLSKPSRANDLEVARRLLSGLAIPVLVFCSVMIAFPVGGSGARSGSGRSAVWYAFLLYLLYWLLTFGAESLVDKYMLSSLFLAAPMGVLTLVALSLWKVHP